MTKQRSLGLTVSLLPGESAANLRFRRHQLNQEITGTAPRPVPSEKLLADLLKRQAKRIMSDVTECPPDTIPAHLARLDDWREIVSQLLRHELRETPESRVSGAQLTQPSTLADWLEVAKITRQSHRLPSYVNHRDEMLERIFKGIDQIAGLIASDPETVEFFATREVA
jgi:hypothetical protein